MAEHQTHIAVQQQDFDLNDEYQQLRADNQTDGAVVTFVGLVRDFNDGSSVNGLFLEHYPGMTEKSLAQIVEQAKSRWPLGRVRVIHRVGQLELADQIVFVGVTSKHRQAAFSACEFIMDYLKTKAPFWKIETTQSGERWIEAKLSDTDKASKW
jgi:molybdopterin synthase catalytic subunit